MKYSYPFLGSMFSQQTADRPSDPKLKDIDSLFYDWQQLYSN